MQHRSVSQLNTWDRCRWAYKLGRVDHKLEAPAAWTIQGNAFHDAAEVYEKAGRKMPIPEAQDLYFRSYDERIKEAKEEEPNLSKWLRAGRTTTENDIAKRRELGASQIEEYIYHTATSGTQPVMYNGEPMVEWPFELDVGEFVIKGRIDLVLEDSTGTLLIEDLKTGNKPDFPIQLYTYAHGFESEHGMKVWWGDYYLAKKGERSSPVDLHAVPKATVLDWFVQMDAEEKAGYYRPNPGDACFACNFKHICDFSV